MKEIKYKFSIQDQLNSIDNEFQTYGCRCNNPDICSNCGLPSCGLTNENHICTTPSRAWKKIFLKKKQEEKK